MVRNLFKKKSHYLMMAFVVALMAGEFAFAQAADIGGMAERFQGFLGSITNLATGGAMVAGVIFGIMGAMKLKEHNADPRSTKVSTPIILFLVSGLLIGLPAYLTYMKNSAVGTSGRANSVDDSVYNDIAQ